MITKYKVQRLYQKRPGFRRTLHTGLTLEQAQRHCQDPETSSDTCTGTVGKQRTRRLGGWFDSYTAEK